MRDFTDIEEDKINEFFKKIHIALKNKGYKLCKGVQIIAYPIGVEENKFYFSHDIELEDGTVWGDAYPFDTSTSTDTDDMAKEYAEFAIGNDILVEKCKKKFENS